MKFIEISYSGEWSDEKKDYVFEPVDCPAYIATSQIEWFEPHVEDLSVIFGVKGYKTVFKATKWKCVAWFNEMIAETESEPGENDMILAVKPRRI